MKKSTLKSLVAFLNGETVTDIDAIRDELVAELNRDEEKAEANRNLYAAARDIVLANLPDQSTDGVTVRDLFEKIQNELPEGFTKGKLSYALSRGMWDGIEKIANGRSAVQYRKA